MLLTNHALTGVFLGLTIDDPYVLAPVAVASHLALDALPHVGGAPLAGRWFYVIGSIDFVATIIVIASACVIWPQRTVTILVGAIGAILPDLIYIPEILFGRHKLEAKIPGYQPVRRFLADIQWYEKPPGLIVDTLWAGLMLWLLAARLP